MLAPTPTPIPNLQRAGGDAGFGLIELVVAIVILAIGAAALAQSFMQVSHLQTANKIRSQRTAVAQAIFNRVIGDQKWSNDATCGYGARNCRPAQTGANFLNITNGSARAPGIGWYEVVDSTLIDAVDNQVKYQANVIATPRDSNSDGTMNNIANPDADSLVDYYDISVRVRAYGPGIPMTQEAVVTGTTNSRQGQTKTGALEVQICQVTSQIDERFSVEDCSDVGSTYQGGHRADIKVPSKCGDASMSTTPGCRGLGGILPNSASISAWNWANTNNPGAPASNNWMQSTIAPVANIRFRVLYADPSPPASVPIVGTGRSGPDGNAIVQRLAPGRYRIQLLNLPTTMRVWQSHSTPSGNFVDVEVGARSKATIVVQPAPVTQFRFQIWTNDNSDPLAPVWVRGALEPHDFKMIPAPYGRSQVGTQWTHVGVAGSIGCPLGYACVKTIPGVYDLVPGIYAPVVILGPSSQQVTPITSRMNTPLEGLWISKQMSRTRPAVPPTLAPASRLPRINFTYCNPARRLARVAVYCRKPPPLVGSWNSCWVTFGGSRVYVGPCQTSVVLQGGVGNGGT